MSLSYDQMSELSIAFQEAHVPADRRRSTRIKQRIAAEITEWKENGAPGRTFGVMIDDFSTTGVGMLHAGRLTAGGKYTLEIPRTGGQPPIRVLLTVVRCSEVAGGMFNTQMHASEILKGREQAVVSKKPRSSMGGVVGLLTAVGAAAIAAYWLLF